MLCPICKVELKMADREGIEIDYCPKCRGVWLDRSELDEIIKRSTGRGDDRGYDEEDEDDSRHNDRDRRGRRRNRDNDDDDDEGGFLGNLFGGFGGRDD